MNRAAASGFEPIAPITIAQTQEAQTGAVALLRVGAVLHDPAGELRRVEAGLLRPSQDSRGRPLQMLLVGFGTVRRFRSESALAATPHVGGDPSAIVEDLDRAAADSHLHRLTRQYVGDAVVVAKHIDVVIDVHARLLPLRVFVTGLGQRREGGAVQRLEETAAGAVDLLEAPIVEKVQETANLPVQLGEGEEGLIPQACQDPALDQENPASTLALSRGLAFLVGSTVVP